MTDALAHRGPDGEGQWCEGPIGLGHRRLAVLDLTDAAGQPMHSLDARYVITYNGEVYNFRELRRELEKTGSRFISHSDTEVVLEAVIRWGIETAIDRFNGMFAFAIWDRRDKRLLLGRDRYGIKPLYVWQGRGLIAVASEPKAFRTLAEFVPVLDAQGVAEYFTFQNILSDRTFLSDVSVFPPGHWGEAGLEDEEFRKFEYWDFNFQETSPPGSDQEYARELRRLLEQATERQLVSDVEVGSFLSGGLDSGSIAAIAARQLPGMKTFTIGFELESVSPHELHFDERAQAAIIADFVGSTQFEMVIGPRHIAQCLPTLVRHLEEPRVGQSYPNFYAAELASKFVKVVFAGTGGDEMLGGYPWRYPPENMNHADFTDWHFSIWQRLLSGEELRSFLLPLAASLKKFDPRKIHEGALKPNRTSFTEGDRPLSEALYFEAKTFLPGLLAVEDRLSMAHGLEVRVPFLDNDLVDFCQLLPRQIRLGEAAPQLLRDGGLGFPRIGKRLLREAMKGSLPDEILVARKQGFSGPDTEWFSRDLRADVGGLLEELDPAIAESMHMKGILNDSSSVPGRSRLLAWSIMASSLHLRDYWPSGAVTAIERTA